MKKPNMDGILKVGGIVVAAIGLLSAIFDTDKTKELAEQVDSLQKRVNELENK